MHLQGALKGRRQPDRVAACAQPKSAQELPAALESQPEAVWQAAAQHCYAASHPVHQADSVRAWLQRQSRLHTNINSGTYQAHSRAHTGTISPDCTKSAAVEGEYGSSKDLHIQDLRTGRTLHRWPLPSTLSFCSGPSYSSSPSSTVVALAGTDPELAARCVLSTVAPAAA